MGRTPGAAGGATGEDERQWDLHVKIDAKVENAAPADCIPSDWVS